MGYNRPPEREWNEPHHQASARLKAKSDLLALAARQYAHGTCDLEDLELAALEYGKARMEKT